MSSLSPHDLQSIFRNIDKNGDGFVSVEELKWLLERMGIQFSCKDLKSIVSNSCLSYDEFLYFYYNSISKKTTTTTTTTTTKEEEEEDDYEELNDISKAFKVFDLNGDGFISSDELEKVLGRLGLWNEGNGRDCRRMIYAYDTNLDGVLDFQEFKNMMLKTN